MNLKELVDIVVQEDRLHQAPDVRVRSFRRIEERIDPTLNSLAHLLRRWLSTGRNLEFELSGIERIDGAVRSTLSSAAKHAGTYRVVESNDESGNKLIAEPKFYPSHLCKTTTINLAPYANTDQLPGQFLLREVDLGFDPENIARETWGYLSNRINFQSPGPVAALLVAYIDIRRNFFRYAERNLAKAGSETSLSFALEDELKRKISQYRKEAKDVLEWVGTHLPSLDECISSLTRTEKRRYNRSVGDKHPKAIEGMLREVVMVAYMHHLENQGLEIVEGVPGTKKVFRRPRHIIEYGESGKRIMVRKFQTREAYPIRGLMTYKGIPIVLDTGTAKNREDRMLMLRQRRFAKKVYGVGPFFVNVMVGQEYGFKVEKVHLAKGVKALRYTVTVALEDEISRKAKELNGGKRFRVRPVEQKKELTYAPPDTSPRDRAFDAIVNGFNIDFKPNNLPGCLSLLTLPFTLWRDYMPTYLGGRKK